MSKPTKKHIGQEVMVHRRPNGTAVRAFVVSVDNERHEVCFHLWHDDHYRTEYMVCYGIDEMDVVPFPADRTEMES